ncbi:type I polyketide synthase [Amycolatopsis silviterrae]|uniref:Type I polyketide synthase n=1 Tax=Amycolatopsis silviterrae TaxID=1656914 RepID=A0ABW5H475_9PSEU
MSKETSNVSPVGDVSGAGTGRAFEAPGTAPSPGSRGAVVRKLLAMVQRFVATALGVERAEAEDPLRRFADLGLDSLAAVELHRLLQDELDFPFPLSDIYDHSTARGLARRLAEHVLGEAPEAPVAAGGPAGAADPVVIVGTACRAPGGVSSPAELWQLVLDGTDAIGSFPADRGWDLDTIYHPDPGRAGRTYARHGGFLRGAAEFDADFFGISPREARAMDPQQRLLMELAWELYERSGIDPLSVAGSSAGVFIGAENHEYGPGLQDARDGAEGHLITGTAGSVASGRISYEFGLHGPALTIDTSSSSSLAALHVAARALRHGECDQAIAGGAAVMAAPGSFLGYSRVRGLAEDGRAKAFGAGANGTAWGEGAGLVLMERQSTAERRGHRILAVFRGSATNSDGASAGLTAPSGLAQQRVIRQALADAGLRPSEVDAVEAHGTGTPLGDPIEGAALHAVYGTGRDTGQPLLLGSLKSNIGHAQAAAGVLGVIKMISAMGAGVLPRTLHADPPTPRVDWAAGTLKLLTRQQEWPDRGRPRRCAVSSFGFSGANVHVVLEQAPAAPEPAAAVAAGPAPLVLSARSRAALRAQASSLREVVRSGARPLDIAFSAATTRAALRYRAVVEDGGLAGLDALAAGEPHETVREGTARHGRLAFVFPGEGAHRLGAGRALHARFPVFAKAFDEACAAADPHLDRPLKPVVFAEPGAAEAALLDRPAYAEPALFVFQVALFRLLESWGVWPDVVAGHTTGEVAAAHVAGIWSLADAAAFAARRGCLAPDPDDPEAALDELRWVADVLTYREPELPVVSAATGALSSTADLGSPGYWVRQAQEPVRFADAVATLAAEGVTTVLELAAGPVLSGLVADLLPDEDAFAAPVLRDDEDETAAIAATMSALHVRAAGPDWALFFAGRGARRVDLPAYPFQRSRFWTDRGDRRVKSTVDHPVLDTAVELATTGETVFTGSFSRRTHAWLDDCRILGRAVVPGAALVELAVRAGDEVGCDRLAEFVLDAPLVLDPPDAVSVQVTVGGLADNGTRAVAVHARNAATAPWTRHAAGVLASGGPPFGFVGAWPPDGASAVELSGCYDSFGQSGFEYGTVFRGLTAAWRRGDDVFAEVRLPEPGEPETFGLHPALLDAALRTSALAGSGQPGVPSSWTDVVLHAAGATALRVHLRGTGAGTVRILAADPAGNPVFSAESVVLRPPSLPGSPETADRLWRLDWTPLPVDAEAQDCFAVLGADPYDLANGLREAANSVESYAQPVADGATVFVLPVDGTSGRGAALAETLATVRAWLADARFDGTRLAVVTRGAVRAGGEPVTDPAAAPVWGLIRSAQAEHPGRLVLVDLDGETAVGVSAAVLAGLLAAGEPQAVIRRGAVRVARLGRFPADAGTGPRAVPPDRSGDGRRAWEPRGTVLITGGTGPLGSSLARHLVTERGVRQLVLAGSDGPAAEGARELLAELGESGARVSAVACDLADRGAVADLLTGLPEAYPLTAVIHVADMADDGEPGAFDEDGLAAELAVAWHLHELTADRALAAFVLVSSAAGLLGSAGSAARAAAAAGLEALAQHRDALGLPATALAWTAGAGRLPDDQEWSSFDRALGSAAPVLVSAAVDLSQYGDQAPHLFRDLVRTRLRRPAAAHPADEAALADRLPDLPEPDREGLLVELIRREAAAVLGHEDAERVEPGRAFKEMGFDSLNSVELRNKLSAATGFRLAPTAVFSHPTPRALAAHLLAGLAPDREPAGSAPPAPAAPRGPAAEPDPIVIVGMSCRYPGGVRSPDELWDLVSGGRDAIGGFPADRGWDLAGLYDPDGLRPGTSITREGGFLADVAGFDARFFRMSPREALAADPQQRILLELAWEAFEAAGIVPGSLAGSATGVFVGAMSSGYASLLPEASRSEGFVLTGNTGSVLSGRISYTFGLEGPSLTVDTACSSSLVSLHTAARALRSGECSLALAGGVAVLAEPSMFVEFSNQGGLAADGRCKSFSADADGTGWAEGAGMLVLERLSDARRRGHPVLAALRGSAVNSDGTSNGLTAPNGSSQQRVIRAALADAGLSASDVDLIEAHGTGTTLGDPIEAQALLATYGQGRTRPAKLGSLKSNLGHAQAAAGVGGVIKTVLSLREGVMPKTLHADVPSPHVDWTAGAVELLTENTTWPELDRPRRAAVSSFGISGTNAHVILEQAPAAAGPGPRPGPAGVVPWVLSAASEPALRAQAARLRSWTDQRPGLAPADVGWSLATTRSPLPRRAAVVGETRQEFLDGLAALSAGGPSASVVLGAGGGETGPVFVFPGQGSQWWGMGRELRSCSPVFRDSVAACAEAFSSYVDWPVAEVVDGVGDTAILDRVDVVQPALFTVMVGLARVWRSHGVEPAAVMGHSQGEIAAAHVAGALSLDDAARVVALRSQALLKLSGSGGMVSIAESAERAAELLAPWGEDVSLAAVNGPSAVSVSGAPAALEGVLAECERRGVRARRIAVDYASHGPQVEAVREDLVRALAPIRPMRSSVPFCSTVSGARIDTSGLGAEYWYTNLRQPVQLERATRTLTAGGRRVFIEMSPHPVLLGGIQETVESAGEDAGVVLGSLRRDEGGARRFLTSLAEAHVHGVPVDWTTVFAEGQPRTVALPTYAFERSRYWAEQETPAPAGGAQDPEFWNLVQSGDVRALAEQLSLGNERAALETVLPAMSAWHERRQRNSAAERWRYRIRWTPVTVADARLSGTWLLAESAETPLGDELAAALAGAGAVVVRQEISADDREIVAGQVKSALDGQVPAGIVSLLGLAEQPHSAAAAVPRGLARTVGLVQALGDLGVEAPLWCVTRGAVAAGPGEVRPAQAALWGFGRVAALEHPSRWGGLIDLPETFDDRTAAQLAGVFSGAGGEDQVALRPSGAFGRRLVRVPAPAGGPGTSRRSRGTVLITGGTGGLGACVARWAAADGARHIVLAARRGLDAPGAVELRTDLENAGARVTVAACDVGDRAAVAGLLAGIPAEFPLTEVFHAAGVLDDVPVEELTLTGLDTVFRAKTAGARNLHELTAGLETFVLFSSGAAIWGGGGQPGYAAANAYLDGLAELRASEGLPVTSVSWGSWAGTGMTADAETRDRFLRAGVAPMDPDLAVAALARAIDDGETALTVADIDWARFAPRFTALRPSPLLSELPEAGAAGIGAGDGEEPPVRRRLLGLPGAERGRALLEVVRAEAAAALGHSSAATVPADDAFRDLGLTSVVAVALRNRLAAVTGLALPGALVFDYPTPRALSGRLLAELFPDEHAGREPVDDEAAVRQALAAIPVGRLRQSGLLGMLLSLSGEAAGDVAPGGPGSIDDLDAESLLRLADESTTN